MPWWIVVRGIVLVFATAVAALSVRVVVPMIAGLPVFQVDQIRVEGVTYLTAAEVRAALRLDDDASLWDPKAVWLEHLESHPLVESVRVERRPPGTLVFTVDEVAPVALAATPVVTPVDALGNVLPIDPTHPVLDLPVLHAAGSDSSATWGLRVLAADLARIQRMAPEVFAIVSEAWHRDALVTLHLGDSAMRIRYTPPITESRLREAVVAMNDAIERFPDRPPREVDLRFEDQVVVSVTDRGAS